MDPAVLPRLSVEREGSGDPLVVLHGLGVSKLDFARVRSLLAESFDVISLDLPGHGDSERLPGRATIAAIADAVERQLTASGVDQPHVVGNSLGGRVALELAIRHRARSVVAIAPSGLATFERPLQAAALGGAGLVMRALRPASSALAASAVGRSLVFSGLRSRPWTATPEDTVAMLRGFGSRPYWSTLWWGTILDVPIGLEKIDCPVHLAFGSHDLLASAQTLRYAAYIRGARASVVPFAGHTAQADAPAAVAEIVRTIALRAPGAGSARRKPRPARTTT